MASSGIPFSNFAFPCNQLTKQTPRGVDGLGRKLHFAKPGWTRRAQLHIGHNKRDRNSNLAKVRIVALTPGSSRADRRPIRRAELPCRKLKHMEVLENETGVASTRLKPRRNVNRRPGTANRKANLVIISMIATVGQRAQEGVSLVSCARRRHSRTQLALFTNDSGCIDFRGEGFLRTADGLLLPHAPNAAPLRHTKLRRSA